MLVLALLAGGLQAEDADPRGVPLTTKADKISYDRGKGLIDATGHVVVRKGDQELSADTVLVDMTTEDVDAVGNVVLRRPGEVWRGDRLRYNFRTSELATDEFSGNADPFQLVWEKAEKDADRTYLLRRAKVTTCTNEHPHCHYHIQARKVIVVPDDHLKAYGTVWYLGRVPLMYLPFWYKNLDGSASFRVTPGYNSRMGFFLLNSYRYRLDRNLRAETHLDYRARRGLGVGQDFKWRGPDRRWRGEMSIYYADDQEPVDDDEDAASADIDSQRFRLLFRHAYTATDRDQIRLQANYLSDTDVLEDFFEDEYRENSEPENYMVYTHRGDGYSASLVLRSRLNDFFPYVNRTPEGSVDFMRQPILETPFYYEGRTAAAILDRVWEAGSANRDYTVLRIDTGHMFYRPAKFFGFLNVIPRVGYRGTYYSQTLGMETRRYTDTTVATNTVTASDGSASNVVTTTRRTYTEPVEVDKGGGLRSRVELGLEASFKAFKVWEEQGFFYRHVVEPYADYAFVPQPSLTPDELYQFDSVDTLDKEHWVRPGVRNKLQVKRDGRAYDLIDLDLWTRYRLETNEGEDSLDVLVLDAQFTPDDWLRIDLDAEYNLADSLLARINSRVTLTESDLWRAVLEYRYINGESSLMIADATYSPNQRWGFNLYGRYEQEENRAEEYGGYVRRTLDCMVVKTGLGMMPGYERSDGTERDDEWRFILEMWLTAFPDIGLHAGKYRK